MSGTIEVFGALAHYERLVRIDGQTINRLNDIIEQQDEELRLMKRALEELTKVSARQDAEIVRLSRALQAQGLPVQENEADVELPC